MKSLLFSLILLSSFSAFAAECSPDAEVVIATIAKQESCYAAANMARECAWGSSMDVSIAGTAAEVCIKETGKLNAADTKLKSSMMARCTKSYTGMQGTMYRSMHAHCNLSAIEFINDVVNGPKS